MTMFDLEPFTDADLDPRRTTKTQADHPVVDAFDSLFAGDLLLVDTYAYDGMGRPTWCEFRYSSPGSAAVYPYKVQIPDKGLGQYAAREILGWARPLDVHELVCTIRENSPLRDVPAPT